MYPWLAQAGGDAGLLVNNLWLIIFILLFLVPMMQRYYLQTARKAVLGKLGKKRGTQVIALIHRQETISFLGIPLARYIDIDDSERVLRAIRAARKDVPIDIILHTPGGLALAATQIAMALRAHPATKTVIVPHYAMSGGTLIAFAADKIIMDPMPPWVLSTRSWETHRAATQPPRFSRLWAGRRSMRSTTRPSYTLKRQRRPCSR